MTAPRKKSPKKPSEPKSMRGRTVIRSDGRILRYPTEPSVIGEDKIFRAVDAVIARRKQ
jgi:hypothetical protein